MTFNEEMLVANWNMRRFMPVECRNNIRRLIVLIRKQRAINPWI